MDPAVTEPVAERAPDPGPEESFDIVVLGAGSAGENLASTLADAGRSVAIVEAHRVGGECPFVACMPSKAMIRSAEVRHLLHHVRRLGAMGDDLDPHRPDRGWARAVERRDAIVSGRDDAGHADALAEAGVTLVRGRGRLTGDGGVVVPAGQVLRRLRGRDVVVATGSAPVMPPVDGLDAVPTWTSDEAWSAQERPASAVVLGGGPVGCEIAQVFARFAVAVTLVEGADRLVGGEEPAVSEHLAGVLRDEGVTVVLGAQAERAEAAGAGVRVHLDDGSTYEAERLVVAVGRRPAVAGIGLEAVGLDADGPLAVDDRCAVQGAEHLWAIGDVTGVAPFTHMANHQARVLADVLTGGSARVDDRAVPRAVFTDPPVAGVGLTAEAAGEAGIRTAVASIDLADTARHAADDGPGGRVVVVADADRGILVGASAIGPAAPEWLTQLVLAVRAAVPVPLLAEVIQPFPTYAEALQPLLADLRARLG